MKKRCLGGLATPDAAVPAAPAEAADVGPSLMGKALAEAQRLFDAALDKIPEFGTGSPSTKLDDIDAGLNAVSNAGSGGTFSSMAGRMFGSGEDLVKQQVELLKAIAKNTAKTERNSREGLAFAP
ncbi:MAG: hypothetical protein KF861_12170 [Planctomycetaceae bacterium]|nr:hypothetical protein [Planctomycetaceae bacterium]